MHLSRPTPTLEDLVDTAKGVAEGMHIASGGGAPPSEALLRAITRAYCRSQEEQRATNTPHFHGLRDFYGLVKDVARLAEMDEDVVRAIHRNFGGLPGSAEAFEAHVRSFGVLRQRGPALRSRPTATELIRANLTDPNARHLCAFLHCLGFL